MLIDDYIGHIVVVELDTSLTYQGLLEAVKDEFITDYVKVTFGSSVDWLPRHEIYKITPIYPKRFVSEE
ncbi:hypothetical protein [Paenibacillus sp. NRS-1760]|uniref:hypothetical protein n=1 Tax=Paenibacillus sp. NRS-1760 TaxID=3233902 RepID=UPI003D2927AE